MPADSISVAETASELRLPQGLTASLLAYAGDSTRFPSVAHVDLVETHISWLLLDGDFVYKIKKPLKLPFLDFSTLDKRRDCCLAEVRLNSRFAPDIYIDVVSIHGSPEGPRWFMPPLPHATPLPRSPAGIGGATLLGGRDDRDGNGNGNSGTPFQPKGPDAPTADPALGPPIEYAVRMRRFDDAQRLDRVCARGELTAAHLSELAAEVARFHAGAAVAPPDAPWATPQRVLALALDNFDDLHRLLVASSPASAGATDAALQRLAALRGWTVAQGEALAPLMARRKAGGHVRECHGDLHLANIVLIDGRVRLFDCIEFNDELRWIDTTAEIAFTYVDLLDHGVHGLAGWFVDEVFSQSGDHEAGSLLRFYAVYRAMVRAKVAALRDAQTHAPGTPDAHAEALGYLTQAEALAAPARPRLVITHGLSGCGKTVASTALVQGYGQGGGQSSLLRLRSDVERKRLFALSPLAASGSAPGQGIYTQDANSRTYDHLAERAALLLHAGWSVVVDAAFLRRAERDQFRTLATHCGAVFQILAPQAPLAELRARIRHRQALGRDASEATVDVLDQQLSWLEPLDAAEQALCIAIPSPLFAESGAPSAG
jgi:uncharacterized protein